MTGALLGVLRWLWPSRSGPDGGACSAGRGGALGVGDLVPPRRPGGCRLSRRPSSAARAGDTRGGGTVHGDNRGAPRRLGGGVFGGDRRSSAAVAGLGYTVFAGTMLVGRMWPTASSIASGGWRWSRVSLLGVAGFLIALAFPAVWGVMAGFAVAGIGLAALFPAMFAAGSEVPGSGGGCGNRRHPPSSLGSGPHGRPSDDRGARRGNRQSPLGIAGCPFRRVGSGRTAARSCW